MAFQTPITIKAALQGIDQFKYALPAIQREFVWKPEQICRLFDSVMRGYPIGSFLFWRLEEETAKQFKFYCFMRDYHEQTHRHCEEYPMHSRVPQVAVLDGQQRLTAFNIALYGSYTWKTKYKHWKNPEAFKARYLHLNLLAKADENEDNLEYDFRFLTEEEALQKRGAGQYWFRVSDVLQYKQPYKLVGFLSKQPELSPSQNPNLDWAGDLHTMLTIQPLINYYEEQDQDLDKVLNIFIRINSGGSVLSYSDLLLSVATAQWTKRDARGAIYSLVDELNSTGQGFSITKDFVLKAGLMLMDISSVGFKVTNFNAENMALLERGWERISRALKLSVRLATAFGLSGQTLRAVSALLPIAYYLYHRDADETYLSKKAHQSDREAIRQWLLRSLLKSGVWGSGLDTLLTQLRTTIQSHGSTAFPTREIEAVMVRRGRSLRFGEDEIQGLMDSVSYGNWRVFMLLSLLYPFIDLRNKFHIDHIFPKTRFHKKRLKQLGLEDQEMERFLDGCNHLANLQLLDGVENMEKSKVLPAAWLCKRFPDEEQRRAYCDRHDLGDVPEEMADFEAFFLARRERMLERMRSLLGATTPLITTRQVSAPPGRVAP